MKRIRPERRRYLLRVVRAMQIERALDSSPMPVIEDRPSCFDRQGRPITFGRWGALYECFPGERMVKRTELPWGGMVSTVWLGLDHGLGLGRPEIFESRVFGPRHGRLRHNYAEVRHSTEAEALDGHALLVAEFQAPPPTQPDAEA